MFGKINTLTVGIVLIYQALAFAQEFTLTGIIYGEDPIAVVNDEIVREKEEIAGGKVEEIGKNFVRFRYEGRIITEYLGHKKSSFVMIDKNKPAPISSGSDAFENSESENRATEKKEQKTQDAVQSKIDAVVGTGLESLFSTPSDND